MKQRLTALLATLFLMNVSVVWAENDPGTDFPAYEPPRLEELPSVIAPEQPAATSPEPSNENVPAFESPDSVTAPAPPVEDVPVAAPAPVMQEYRVWIWQENGDSLSMIAKKLYGDPQKWRLIYLANKDVIKDPDKIYPKQKLKIPPADWTPDIGL